MLGCGSLHEGPKGADVMSVLRTKQNHSTTGKRPLWSLGNTVLFSRS